MIDMILIFLLFFILLGRNSGSGGYSIKPPDRETGKRPKPSPVYKPTCPVTGKPIKKPDCI